MTGRNSLRQPGPKVAARVAQPTQNRVGAWFEFAQVATLIFRLPLIFRDSLFRASVIYVYTFDTVLPVGLPYCSRTNSQR